MEESTVSILLILGITSGVTIYLGETHRVHWRHAGIVWTVVSSIVGSYLGVKELHNYDVHSGTFLTAIKEWIVPIGIPALVAIGTGAGLGWLAAQIIPSVQSKF